MIAINSNEIVHKFLFSETTGMERALREKEKSSSSETMDQQCTFRRHGIHFGVIQFSESNEIYSIDSSSTGILQRIYWI